MGRQIFRGYLATPELIKDSTPIPPVPGDPDDWLSLQRLLVAIRAQLTNPAGTITGRTFRTAVEPDKRVQISTAEGIEIYDENNELVAHLDGDELTIIGGTITGATFQTNVSPNERIVIDSANGMRVYDSSNVLRGQIDDGLIDFDSAVFDQVSSSPATVLTLDGIAGTSLKYNGTLIARVLNTGVILDEPVLYFNSTTNADVKITGVGTALWVGLADGSGFADLEARTITATTSVVTAALQCDSITNDTGLASGTYTPTLTDSANLDATSSGSFYYTRVGNVVSVTGIVSVDPTAAGATPTEFGVSLPVASNFAAASDCRGACNSANSSVIEVGFVFADTTNDRATVNFYATSTANHTLCVAFMYTVI